MTNNSSLVLTTHCLSLFSVIRSCCQATSDQSWTTWEWRTEHSPRSCWRGSYMYQRRPCPEFPSLCQWIRPLDHSAPLSAVPRELLRPPFDHQQERKLLQSWLCLLSFAFCSIKGLAYTCGWFCAVVHSYNYVSWDHYILPLARNTTFPIHYVVRYRSGVLTCFYFEVVQCVHWLVMNVPISHIQDRYTICGVRHFSQGRVVCWGSSILDWLFGDWWRWTGCKTLGYCTVTNIGFVLSSVEFLLLAAANGQKILTTLYWRMWRNPQSVRLHSNVQSVS